MLCNVIPTNIPMNKKLFFLFILFLFFSCANRQTTNSLNENKAHYIIDLDGKKEQSIPYSSIFKNVQTILLETSQDCLIGSVNELQVFDGCIYLLDRAVAKSLFVFDREGRFIRKIGGLGYGPGEYVQILDFTIDTEKRFIFLQDQATRVHKYRLDGTYVHSITIQIPRSNSYYIQFYNGRLYASTLAWERNRDDYMLLEIDPDDGKILSRHLPIKYNKGWTEAEFMGNFFMSRLNSPPRYAQLFMDCIVSLDEEISSFIELKSKNLVKEKDLENLPEGAMNIIEKLSHFQGSSKIWHAHSLVENDDFILFKYDSGLFDFFTVVFHKDTETVQIAKNLSNDLVLKQTDDPKSGIPDKFSFSDAHGAYAIVLPFVMNHFLESVRNNQLLPDLDKLDQLKKLDEDSNPVIFFYEYK